MKNVLITTQHFPHIPPRLLRLSAWFVGIALLIGVGIVLVQSDLIANLQSGAPVGTSTSASATAAGTATAATVELRSATEGVALVSAAGNLEVAAEQQVIVEVAGTVKSIAVNVGDVVEAGDLLLSLDSSEAELAVQQALLSQASAQAALDGLLIEPSAAEITAAEATLRAAQETLADVMDGASAQELASANSALAAAQANYTDLIAPPSAAELAQVEASLRQAEVTVAEAQTAYDKVAWQNNVGMTSQAADLQNATLAYEAALAAYNQASAPAADGDVQSALSSITNAQQTLADLQAQPSAADIASGEATVANAEQALQDLLNGESSASLAAARVTLSQAELELQAAAADLAKSEVRAPTNGTVLAVDLAVGQQTNAGTTAVTLADISKLLLTVNVAETDIAQVRVGMPVAISIDALPGKTYSGEVLRIAPSSDPDQSVVNYPVTIQLDDANLDGVRAGMTAVAEMQSESLAGAWLAPLSAVQEIDGQSQLVVIRNGVEIPIAVTTGQIQGEWVVVVSPELQEGDAVADTLASYVDEDTNTNMGPGGGGLTGGSQAGGPPQ